MDEKTKKPKVFNASPEAVRKYYSVKQYFFGGAGAPNFFVLKRLRLIPDSEIMMF